MREQGREIERSTTHYLPLPSGRSSTMYLDESSAP